MRFVLSVTAIGCRVPALPLSARFVQRDPKTRGTLDLAPLFFSLPWHLLTPPDVILSPLICPQYCGFRQFWAVLLMV